MSVHSTSMAFVDDEAVAAVGQADPPAGRADAGARCRCSMPGARTTARRAPAPATSRSTIRFEMRLVGREVQHGAGRSRRPCWHPPRAADRARRRGSCRRAVPAPAAPRALAHGVDRRRIAVDAEAVEAAPQEVDRDCGRRRSRRRARAAACRTGRAASDRTGRCRCRRVGGGAAATADRTGWLAMEPRDKRRRGAGLEGRHFDVHGTA